MPLPNVNITQLNGQLGLQPSNRDGVAALIVTGPAPDGEGALRQAVCPTDV